MFRSKQKKELFSKDFWLFGIHCITSAIANDRRKILELCATKNAYQRLSSLSINQVKKRGIPVKIVSTKDLVKRLPIRVVHQGIGMRVAPLRSSSVQEILANNPDPIATTVVILDRVTDPYNIGSILRSAALFGVKAVIVSRSHSPSETGVLAKAACGALEKIPYIRVANIRSTMEMLKAENFWCIGLSPFSKKSLQAFTPYKRMALIIGSEDSGIRHLTQKSCDATLSITTLQCCDMIDSLNVSNATAIALYTLCQDRSFDNDAI